MSPCRTPLLKQGPEKGPQGIQFPHLAKKCILTSLLFNIALPKPDEKLQVRQIFIYLEEAGVGCFKRECLTKKIKYYELFLTTEYITNIFNND